MTGRRLAVLFILTVAFLVVLSVSSEGTKAGSIMIAGGNNVLSCSGPDGIDGNADDSCPGEGDEALASADMVFDFGTPAPSHNWSGGFGVVFFIPPDFAVNPGWKVDLGALMGNLLAKPSLGTFNNPCNNPVDLNLNIQNATVDTADTFFVSLDMTNANDDPDADGLQNIVEHYPSFLNEFLDPDDLGPKPALKPRARFAGVVNLVGQDNILQFLVFDPGQLQEFASPHPLSAFGSEIGYGALFVLNNPVAPLSPGPITDNCAPVVATVKLWGKGQDNPAVAGNQGGDVTHTNPAANTGLRLPTTGAGSNSHLFQTWAMGLRDFDGDGLEAGLDSCDGQYDYQDPRLTSGDGDRLDPVCDTIANGGNPVVGVNDIDGDSYFNGVDNCPLAKNDKDNCVDVSNVAQTDVDGDKLGAGAGCDPADNVAVPDQDVDGVINYDDNCPTDINTGQDDADFDGIGDACDPTLNTYGVDPDGDGFLNRAQYESEGIPLGAAGGSLPADGGPDEDGMGDACDADDNNANGAYHSFMLKAPVCIGNCLGTGDDDDDDNDGWTDIYETAVGSPTNAAGVGDADGDGVPNKGADGLERTADDDNCPAVYNPTQADTDGFQDGDGIGDACETGRARAACNNNTDDDGEPVGDDALINDGCPQLGAAPEGPGADCADNQDDDNDGITNDGCIAAGAMAEGTQDYDGDGRLNLNAGAGLFDNCDVFPNPAQEDDDGDGIGNYCDTTLNYDIGVTGRPENIQLTYMEGTINDVGATASPPGTDGISEPCDDGMNNDGDANTDGADAGCTPQAGDTDADGVTVANGDNCTAAAGNDTVLGTNLGGKSVRNPTQTDTDAGGRGDACDMDDDADGYEDVIEWRKGSDPLDLNSRPEVCDGVDNDGDGLVDEGYAATCNTNGADADGDGVGNLTDLNDDSKTGALDNFPDTTENAVGADKEVRCTASGASWAIGVDKDPYDNTIDTFADVSDVLRYVSKGLNTAQGSGEDFWARGDIGPGGSSDTFVDVSDVLYYTTPGILNAQCPYGQ